MLEIWFRFLIESGMTKHVDHGFRVLFIAVKLNQVYNKPNQISAEANFWRKIYETSALGDSPENERRSDH